MLFNLDNWLITYELEQMQRYLDLLHASIDENQKRFDASIDEIASTMSEGEKEDFYSFHEDDFVEVSEDFPRLLFPVLW